MLNSLKNFSITCNMTSSQFWCEVNEGFAAVVPETSYCQINDESTRVKCEKIIMSLLHYD